MDEEQSKNKINVNSFFERVDSVEKVASSALTKSDSVMNVANANKLLVESLQLTVEAMQTEIRDIANYIIVENKLEKDLKEDRLLEEQDTQQKKDFEDKLLGLKGPAGPQGPQGVKGEDFGSKGGGGSFLGGLLKGLMTLGAGAFALKFMWPALLPVIKGAIGSAVSGGVKFLGGAVGKTLIGILGGIPIVGAAAKLIGGGIEKTANKAGDGLEKTIKNMGEDGKVDVPTFSGGGGRNNPPEKKEVDKEVEPEKKENKILEFVKKGGVAGYLGRKMFGDKKDDTTEKKLDTRFDEDTGRAYVNGQEVDVEKYNEFKSLSPEQQAEQGLDFFKEDKEEIKPEKKENKLLEFVKKGGGLAGKVFGMTPMGMGLKLGMKAFGDKEGNRVGGFLNNMMGISPAAAGTLDANQQVSQVEPIVESEEVGSLETPDRVEMGNSTNVTEVTIPPTPPPVENSTPLVQAKPPQVSDAEIKITEAPIPFRKLISSKKYLSVSDMNKSGLPPEIAKMIS